MRLSEAIDHYCQYGRYELNHSKSTFANYSVRLRHLGRWLTEN